MIQEYNCYGDGDMIAVKAGNGNWVRYTDHLAEVERAIKIALQKNSECDVKDFCEYTDTNSCVGCIVNLTMEELKK